MQRQEEQQCIFNLIPQPEKTVRKERMYRSRHNPKAAVIGSTFGVHGTTRLVGAGQSNTRQITRKPKTGGMGKPLGMCKPDPSNFLRGGKSKTALGEPKPFSRTGARKAGIPKANERPVVGLQSTKNYVTANAVEAILAVPGSRARVSNQAPRYRNKVDYGRVPAYLSDVKDEINKENEMIEQYFNDGQGKRGADDDGEEMEQQEVENLLRALKIKWGEVNSKYQKKCHMVKLDTIGKVRRKEQYEAQLTQLEKDIEKLERRKVYVHSSSGSRHGY